MTIKIIPGTRCTASSQMCTMTVS